MKLLFVITDLEVVGGAELALVRLAQFLRAETSFEVEVVSLKRPGKLAPILADSGVPVRAANTSVWNGPLAFIRVLHMIRDARADVVCSFMFHANTVAQFARMVGLVPSLLSFERTMNQDGFLRRSVKKFGSRWADEVIAVSGAVREYCCTTIGIPTGKLSVLGNGVDVSRFVPSAGSERFRRVLGIGDDIVLITCVANLRPIKGQSFLLEAFARIISRCPDTALALVGGGPDRGSLEHLASKLAITSRVHFLGTTDNVADILAVSDIFVMPSLTEGMSNAIIEAMATGCAVVATCVGGTPDIIIDPQTGLLVPPANVDALSAAIAALVENSEMRKRLGDAAAAQARSAYSMESVGRQFVDLIYRHAGAAAFARTA